MTRDYESIQRVLFLTLLLNFAATAVKLSVGIWSGALSLVADGLDTLFDSISNIVGLAAIRISRQPPDKEHPYGHRKFETLAALFIATALLISAWELGRTAIARIFDPVPVTVNYITVIALIAGSLVQAVAGLWEWRQAKRLESELLLADARHTLATIGISATVLVGLVLVWWGFAWVDSVITLVVAAFIAKIAVDTVRENVPALVDRAPLEADNIGAIVADVEGVVSYHRIRSRGPSDQVAIDLHVRVAPNLAMQEANAIADEVRRRLLELPGVDDVTVHAEAHRDEDSASDLYSAVKLAAQEVGIVLHEVWIQEADRQLSLHLHVGVPPTLTLEEAHDLVDQLEQTILERQTEISSVHSHIELANADILPSARVTAGLQKRVYATVQTAAAQIPALRTPHNIQVRQVEGKLFITLEALVDGQMSVADAHELSTQLQEAIRSSALNVGEVLVHLEPAPLIELAPGSVLK